MNRCLQKYCQFLQVKFLENNWYSNFIFLKIGKDFHYWISVAEHIGLIRETPYFFRIIIWEPLYSVMIF